MSSWTTGCPATFRGLHELGGRFRYYLSLYAALQPFVSCFVFFFFQAEDGIRDYKVTGVQTCALPISVPRTGYGRRPGAAYARGHRETQFSPLATGPAGRQALTVSGHQPRRDQERE